MMAVKACLLKYLAIALFQQIKSYHNMVQTKLVTYSSIKYDIIGGPYDNRKFDLQT